LAVAVEEHTVRGSARRRGSNEGMPSGIDGFRRGTGDGTEQGDPPSGVHAVAGTSHEEAMSPLIDQVTLIVYGWKSVEPGTLWWVFPSFSAALSAARAMTNAVKWAIVAGTRGGDVDVTVERARGAVLVEQPG
jgi:hypothetical protein